MTRLAESRNKDSFAAGSPGASIAADRRPVIIHVLDQFAMGGMETVALSVIEQTQAFYRHEVVCLRAPGALALRLRERGVPLTSLDKRPGKDIAVYWRLRRLLRHRRPQLVHTYNIGAVDAAFWARMAGVRRVVHAEHGRDAADPLGRNAKYRWLRRILAPAIDAFVAVSADLSTWLCEDVGIPRDKIHLIRNGIDTEHYRATTGRRPACKRSPVTPDSVAIGSVGRLNAVKAFDVLIEAFARLCQRLPDRRLQLLIVGDGPERQTLEQRVQALGLQDRVVLTGARDDVECMLRSLDIYVCSSIAEGVALTILEAMASELPVIATEVGGNPELVVPHETGILVAPSCPQALAAALQQLVEQPDTAQRYGRAGRERVCRYFSIEAMTESYCRLYDQLLGVVERSSANQARS